ncbi:MAG: hypothetical protein AAFP97_13445, partial [Pseudomonadota bacterium]
MIAGLADCFKLAGDLVDRHSAQQTTGLKGSPIRTQPICLVIIAKLLERFDEISSAFEPCCL